MGKATQEGRLLHITTPLGEDYIVISKLAAKEELSELFEFDLEILFDENDEDGYESTNIDVKKILGQTVTVSILQEDGGTRNFTGMVNQFAQLGRKKRYSFYHAKLVPHVWKLTQNCQSKIFQHITVPDILKEIFAGFEVKYQTKKDYRPRNYCVQYQESDFAFASRLMEEEGIYYYFEHSEEMDKMIIRDDFTTPENTPNKHEIAFWNEQLVSEGLWESAIETWLVDYKIVSGKHTLWDHNFELPGKKLDAEQTSIFDVGGNQELEIYKYPAGYARKYDDIDKSGSEKKGDTNNIFQDNSKTVKNMMLALDVQHKIISAQSTCSTMTSGYRFHFKNHPNNEYNAQYIITAIEHVVDQAPSYLITDEKKQEYQNKFTCIPHGSGHPEYRPPQKTPKPITMGTQTATVVGPEGEEIFTDKYGRVKVQFHWDRDGMVDANSSCWIRVAQAWAGNQWGTMFIPRIGMEVIVDFINGNPDNPIITGCVYNPRTMPPYSLPEERTKSTIKSDSTIGGGGFNEIRFEDKKGEEQIFVHGEKDIDIRNKNDRREYVGNDHHFIVHKNRREMIEENEHHTVVGDKFEEIRKNHHLKIKKDDNIEIGGNLSLQVKDVDIKCSNHSGEATGSLYLKGMNVVLEGAVSISLKVGGNFITVNSGGVQISGLPAVLINSGGSAGVGQAPSPVSPTKVDEPDPADDNKPGSKITLDKKSAARKQKTHKESNSGNKDGKNANKEKTSWIKIKLVDEAGNPVSGVSYKITTPEGRVASGSTNKEGKAEVKSIDPGNCKITFPGLDKEAWEEG